jgi:hypothetical protein
VPGQTVARVDLVPQWDTQHNSPAQSLAADVHFHELARRCTEQCAFVNAIQLHQCANLFCTLSLDTQNLTAR